MKRARFVTKNRLLILAIFCVVIARLAGQGGVDNEAGWPNYGNDPGGTRYSLAKQINRNNVARLKVAWTFRTGALPHDEELDHKAA